VAVEAQEVENGTNGEGSENFVVLPLATRTTGTRGQAMIPSMPRREDLVEEAEDTEPLS
jgi:hypothetical protein